jgi:hypothetical protein
MWDRLGTLLGTAITPTRLLMVAVVETAVGVLEEGHQMLELSKAI